MAFIVFEGLDGSGKSTLIQGIKKHIEENGSKVHVTREPGGTPLGEEIRRLLLTTKGDSPTKRCELLLYQAIRAQHVETVIEPKLKAGDWVLCDRFTASSIAFQGGARGLDLKDVEWLNQFSTGGLKPDLVILLDLSVEEAKKRLNKRYESATSEMEQELDRFEKEEAPFHQRVRDSYLAQAKQAGSWLILDSTDSPENLLHQALIHLRQRGWIS